MEELSDNDRIKSYLEGNTEDFEFLIEKYTPQIYGFLYRMIKSEPDADDITQDTFVKAWRKIGTYRVGENFRGWLFSIAHNTAIDWLRRKKKQYVFSDFDRDEENSFLESIPDTLPLADELVARSQDAAAVQKYLEELSPQYREVLVLHYTNEFTFDEIGKMLHKPLNTVKSQHRRALAQLKDLLNAPHDED